MLQPILIVDDEPQARSLAAAVLESAGLATVMAADVVAARGRLARGLPLMVVLEILLPGGLELYRDLAASQPPPPVLVVTGLSRRSFMKMDKITRMFPGGHTPPPAGYIEKPASSEELAAAAGMILGRRI